MGAAITDLNLAKVTTERDLYLRLLGLGQQKALEPFLEEALGLVVDVTGAQCGYLEFYDEDSDEPRWWAAHALSEEEIGDVRKQISRGIIAEALASSRLVVTPSALLDPRFNARESVRLSRIEAVLCAPIGEDGVCGVLYLQRRSGPGAFPESDQHKASLFARHVAPVARPLIAERRSGIDGDPLRSLRESLRLNGIIGHSTALGAVLRQVALVSPLDVTVLLTGESGSGKSLLARVIHDNGPRAVQPFVEVNCGALPESLLESELFGALAGAHSTATKRIDGKVTAAQGGTLFLDEIGALPPSSQAKLLQLLQSKQYYPLGSSTPVQANVRVIAATNIDLERAVAERQFREDLYYRLHVLPVRVPSLAERHEDLAELAAHLSATACECHGLPHLPLSRNALRAVQTAPWPGNVRQLANLLEAAAIRAAGEHAAQIEASHIFPNPPPAKAPEDTLSLTFQEATRVFQQRLLAETLERCDWNVTEAARRLDLTRSHAYNLIRAFGLRRSDS